MALQLSPDPPPLQSLHEEETAAPGEVDRSRNDDGISAEQATQRPQPSLTRPERALYHRSGHSGAMEADTTGLSTSGTDQDDERDELERLSGQRAYGSTSQPTQMATEQPAELVNGRRKVKRRRRSSVVKQAAPYDMGSESSSGGAGWDDDNRQQRRFGQSESLSRSDRDLHHASSLLGRVPSSNRARSASRTNAGGKLANGLAHQTKVAEFHETSTSQQQSSVDAVTDITTKGKGKQALAYHLPVTGDPFDPLSTIQSRPKSAMSNSFSSPAYLGSQTDPNPSSTLLSTRRGPPTAASYPSSESLASSSQFSSSGPSSTAYGSQSGGHQPSLQQLLQTVDLGAALKLVQTLQTQPLVPQSHAPTTSAPPAAMSAPKLSISTTVPSSTDSQSAIASFAGLQRAPFSGGFTSALSPIPASAVEEANSTPITLHTVIEQDNNTEDSPSPSVKPSKKDRPRHLSFLGRKGSSKRKRVVSAVEALSAPLRGPERVPDERAAMGEVARSFEEQISRVHLSLSPATLRRAQYCAKYLSMRYTPLFAAMDAEQEPPNLLTVARWRERREETERMQRRATYGVQSAAMRSMLSVANSGSPRVSDVGSGGRSSGGAEQAGSGAKAAAAVTSYGPRRNKYPKIWELYPDDITDFTRAKQLDTPDSIYQDVTAPFRFSALARHSTTGSDLHTRDSVPPVDEMEHRDHSLDSSQTSAERAHATSPSLVRPVNLRHDSFEKSPLGKHTTTSDLEPTSSISPASLGRSKLSNVVTSFSPQPSSYSTKNHLGNGHGSTRFYATSASNSKDNLLLDAADRDMVRDNLNGLQLSSDALGSPLSPQSSSARHGSTSLQTPLTIDSRPRLKQQVGPAGQKLQQVVVTSESETGGQSPRSSLMPARGIDPRTRAMGNKQRFSSVDLTSSTRGYDSEGLRSSGEEMLSPVHGPGSITSHRGIGNAVKRRGGQSRRLLAAAWQGLQKTLDSYPGFDESPNFAQGGLHPQPVPKPDQRRHAMRNVAEDDTDEEDEKVVKFQREVLDIGDEEFDQINGALRRLRAELEHVDDTFEHTPIVIDERLQALTRNESHMLESFGIEVKFSYPRLHASVLSQVARVKAKRYHEEEEAELDKIASGSETDTESSSLSSASDTSREEYDRDQLVSPSSAPRRLDMPLKRPRRQSSFNIESIRQRPVGRRPSTDLLSAKSKFFSRPRSQTASVTFGSGNPTSSPPGQHRRGTIGGPRAGVERTDQLILLEKAIEEMSRQTKVIDVDAEQVIATQAQVDKDIASVVQALDRVQKSIDDYYFQKLRMLEDHFFRLQQSRVRPSATVDALWTLLAGTLAVVLWLLWLVVTLLRGARGVILVPVRILRRLLLLG
ncbi:hypothetical protein OIO90_002443 [Microbotryomycetes sp. JL221]|nr:hypothetical protein OIO90_002443 [Microbotryomycetes sp. JL221]